MTNDKHLNGYVEELDEDMAADLSPKGFYPTCRFCGCQSIPFAPYASQELADEAATISCSCFKGLDYRAQKEREQQRERNIKKLNVEINNVATYCMDRNVDVSESTIALLNNCGVMVLEDKVDSANIAFSRVKVKMSKNSKGAIIVSVSYSDGARAEI